MATLAKARVALLHFKGILTYEKKNVNFPKRNEDREEIVVHEILSNARINIKIKPIRIFTAKNTY